MGFEVAAYVLSFAFLAAVAGMVVMGLLGMLGGVRIARCEMCERWFTARNAPAGAVACFRCRHAWHPSVPHPHLAHALRVGHVRQATVAHPPKMSERADG